MFSVIVCVNNKNVIGKDNKLLYRLSSDLTFFKKMTTNNVVIMGKKTYDSLPIKPLPNRVNIVITHDEFFYDENVIVVHSIEECIELCNNNFLNKKCFVIGGGQIYKEFFDRNLVHEVFSTQVNDNSDGDTYFPSINKKGWIISSTIPIEKSEKDSHEYEIQIWHKI